MRDSLAYLDLEKVVMEVKKLLLAMESDYKRYTEKKIKICKLLLDVKNRKCPPGGQGQRSKVVC